MRIKILLLSFCIAFYNALSGQNPVETAKTNDFYPKARVVGLNMTPLITHFVPFNRADPKQAGPFLIRFRNYGKKNNAFRLGLGVSILSDDFTDNITDNFLHLQIGWEKRKNISQRWATTGLLILSFRWATTKRPAATTTTTIPVAWEWVSAWAWNTPSPATLPFPQKRN
jgi:hypothetical protein